MKQRDHSWIRRLALLGAGLVVATGVAAAEDWSVAGRAKELIDTEHPDALPALVAECRERFPAPAAYAEAIKTICAEAVANPRVERQAYRAVQDAASTVLTPAAPEAVRIAHRLSLSLTRTNNYLRDLAPEEWRSVRSRNCQILAAFARRLTDQIDPAFDPARRPQFRAPDGLVLPPNASDALPAPEDIADPAVRAAYVAELTRFEQALLHQRQQVNLKSVWGSFRKDLVIYLVASHTRHPTDFTELAEAIALCGLETDREAIIKAVAEGSHLSVPAGLLSAPPPAH